MNTARTHIRPLQFEDFDEIISMYHEPDSNKYIQPLEGKSDAFYRAFLSRKLESNLTTHQFWVARELAENQLIGTLNLNQFAETNMIHLGCHLSMKYWNQGFGKELMSRIIEFGFRERQLEQIFAFIDQRHEVSLKLFHNLGFKHFENRMLGGVYLQILKLQKKQLNTAY